MMTKKIFALFAIACIFLLFSHCSKSKTFKENKPNIIIITVDALRADHLSTYGYKYHTSPHIDDFAKKSILFEYAYCPIPKTSASFASFMTGLHPFVHDTRPNRDILKEKYITLAEALRLKDYYNYAVVDNGNLSKAFKFHQGFNKYIQVWNRIEEKEESSSFITEKVLEFLDNNKRKPFFLWAHYIETHTPYLPPEGFVEERPDGRIIKQIKHKIIAGERRYMDDNSDEGDFLSLYDGAVKYSDSEFGKIIDFIFDKGYHKNTIIIFSSDHGEELGEYNFFYNHGPLTFNSSSRVPLIIYIPGEKSRRIKYPVSLMDIYPTLLEKLGLSNPYKIQGVNLFKKPKNRYLYMIGHKGTRSVVFKNYHVVKVQSQISKRLNLKRNYFFDIYKDPYEIKNMAETKKKLQKLMDEKYIEFLDKHGYLKNESKKKEPTLSKKDIESLKSLGYIK